MYDFKATRSVSQELRYQIPIFPCINQGFFEKQWNASRSLENKEYLPGFGVDCKPIESNRGYWSVCEGYNAAYQLGDNIILAITLSNAVFIEGCLTSRLASSGFGLPGRQISFKAMGITSLSGLSSLAPWGTYHEPN
jgi:hypothetical protein